MDQLKDACRAKGIKFTSKAKRADLVAMLTGVAVNNLPPPPKSSSAGKSAATQKEGDEALAAEMTGGATTRFGQKLVELRVVNTFRVKYKLNKKGAFRAEPSSFDGTMVKKLFANGAWSKALDAAFSGLSIDCPHRLIRCAQGSCSVCDLYHVYDKFGTWLLPSMRAMTWEQFADKNDYMGEGESFVFDKDAWNTRVMEWGTLYKQVFAEGQNKRVIQNYFHYYISHSGQLMAELNHPLGFDSQQAVEAAHKEIKRAFFGATSHSGGKAGASNSLAAVQIMLRAYRVLLYAIRIRFEAVERGSEHSALVLKILSKLGYNRVSRKLIAHSDELHVQRLEGFLDDKLQQPDDEDDNLNLPSVRTDL